MLGEHSAGELHPGHAHPFPFVFSIFCFLRNTTQSALTWSLLYRIHYSPKLYTLAAQMGWSDITAAWHLLEHTAYFSGGVDNFEAQRSEETNSFVCRSGLPCWPPGPWRRWPSDHRHLHYVFLLCLVFTFQTSLSSFEVENP